MNAPFFLPGFFNTNYLPRLCAIAMHLSRTTQDNSEQSFFLFLGSSTSLSDNNTYYFTVRTVQ
jgi:hypothetical protein